MSRLDSCRCGHPGAGCYCYDERRAEADARDRAADPAPTTDLTDWVGDWLVKNLFWGLDPSKRREAAELLLSKGPLADRLAAADRDAAALARVRALDCSQTMSGDRYVYRDDLDRALGGDR